MLSDAGILRFTRLHDVLRMQQKAMLHAQVSHNTVSKSTLAMCDDGPATARNVCLILSSMSNEDLVRITSFWIFDSMWMVGMPPTSVLMPPNPKEKIM